MFFCADWTFELSYIYVFAARKSLCVCKQAFNSESHNQYQTFCCVVINCLYIATEKQQQQQQQKHSQTMFSNLYTLYIIQKPPTSHTLLEGIKKLKNVLHPYYVTNQLVNQLVGALSSVNRQGSHQGKIRLLINSFSHSAHKSLNIDHNISIVLRHESSYNNDIGLIMQIGVVPFVRY